MRPVIYYRTIEEFDRTKEDNELQYAEKYFKCIDSFIDAEPGDLVIPRYSALPFFNEVSRDIEKLGARTINSYRQHRYIANLAEWYTDLEDYTFKTWFDLIDIPPTEKGPFVLKGETNSKKFLWSTHAFAKDRDTATQVYLNLLDDSLIGTQRIVIRKFEPLVTYETISSHKLPVTKEFRVFVAYGKIISSAYYWSQSEEWLIENNLMPSIEEIPEEWLQQCISIVGTASNFYAIDVAQSENGKWFVVELNDGMMSGLSSNDPDILYKNLYDAIMEQK